MSLVLLIARLLLTCTGYLEYPFQNKQCFPC